MIQLIIILLLLILILIILYLWLLDKQIHKKIRNINKDIRVISMKKTDQVVENKFKDLL